MKAFRNIAGNVVEILVDVDPSGNPILPPDTTVDPKPEVQEGHYVTVVGREWVQIPIPQEFKAFETLKNEAIQKLQEYRTWSLEQPVVLTVEGTGEEIKFDADEQARARINHALTIHSQLALLPPVWITYDNSEYPLTSVEDLKAIANAVFNAYNGRFFACSEIRKQIFAAQDEVALTQAIELIPQIQTQF